MDAAFLRGRIKFAFFLAFAILLVLPIAGLAEEVTETQLEPEAGLAEAAHPEGNPVHLDDADKAAGHSADHGEVAAEHPVAHGAEAEAHGDGHGHGGEELGKQLPLWSAIPFAGILLSIALFPLFAPHFWHSHFPKVSAFWAIAFAVPFLFVFKGVAFHEIAHIYLIDYIPFIILLWGLFTVSGGMVVSGKLRGTPLLNCIFLIIGTLLASWIGTTGASMVLIRPVLRANAERTNKVHIIVFFIFLVSNIGGSLTPLGDPPLFLGFLHGVPFFWTFALLRHMLTAAALLMVLFFFLDTYYYRKDLNDPNSPLKADTGEKGEPLKLKGMQNTPFLLGIIGAVLISGILKLGSLTVLGVHMEWQNILRDGLIILMGVLSLIATPRALREENEFTWFPIKEVAYLFAGIFMTIIPALAILKAGSDGDLGWLIASVQEPVHYFWMTGILSSFLDNAPTYLTFFNSALGKFYPGMPESEAVARLIAENGKYLMAIAAGAVFMGANTYIGNAPNFMVRSIAEEAGIKMPSFFGYMLKWSIPILIPVFVIITLIYFWS